MRAYAIAFLVMVSVAVGAGTGTPSISKTTGSSVSTAAGTASVTWSSVGFVTYSIVKNADVGGAWAYQVGIWRTDGNLGGFGTEVKSFSGSAGSESGSLAVPTGTWLLLYTRQVSTDWNQGTSGELIDNYVYFQMPGTDPGEGGGGTEYVAKLKYYNDKPYAVKARVKKNGTDISSGGFLIGANTMWTRTIEDVSPEDDITLEILLDDVVFDSAGGTWVVSEGSVHIAKTENVSPAVAPVGTAVETTVPTTDNLPSKLPTGATSGGSVWRPGGTGGGSGDGLTNGVYREGIDKITTRQDEQKEKQDEQTEHLKTLAETLKPEGRAAYEDATALQATAATKAGAATAYEGPVPTGSGSASGMSAPSSALWSGEVAGQSLSIGLNGFAALFPTADGLLVACRPILLLCLVVWFARSGGQLVQRYAVGLGSVDTGGANFGAENFVPGVAQAKSWGAAAVAATVICVAIAGMVAVVNTWMGNHGFGVATLLSGTSFDAIGQIWGVLDRYVPLAALVQLGLINAALPYVLAPIYATAATVLKFLKV